MVQPMIDARLHLRVVTVADRCWVAELDAAGLPLDWRASAEAHSSFQASDHSVVAEEAARLAVALDVGYSSQDWLIDANANAYFLDLNPAGQWLFLPDEISNAVTRHIAEWLVPA